MECSALHYTPADFLAAKHTNELEARSQTFFNLDWKQRGLGTASCGEDTLTQYRIHAGKHSFEFKLLPFAVNGSIAAIARESVR
jgi:beta-galactosidase